jgi:hemerythrin superfamily protein
MSSTNSYRYLNEDRNTVLRLAEYYWHHYRSKEQALLDEKGRFHSMVDYKAFKAKLKKCQTRKREWKAVHKKVAELMAQKSKG